MKKLTYIFLSLLVLAGCTGTSRQPQLVAMDSLLLSRPDSALTLLRGMSFTDKADRMYHYLLLADACNKCYDTLPSDTILQEVADYYDRHGTPNEQVRAHYLLGCAYRDMGEAPQALQCYHDAVDHADTTAKDCNYRLLMSVYGQMAEIFHLQNLPLDEIEALELSGKCSLLNRDTIHYLRSLELTSKAYDLLGDTAHLIDIIEKTNILYRKHNNPQMAYSGNATLAYISIKRGDLKTAKKLLHEFENYSGLFNDKGEIAPDRTLYYYVKGFYYYHINQLDSAESFMRKLLYFGDLADGYKGLLTIFQRKNSMDSIVKYICLYEDAIDTLSNRKRTEVIHQMASMYNYHRFQIKAEQEASAARRLKWTFGLVSLLVLVILLAITRLYMYSKKKRQLKMNQLHSNYLQAQIAYNKKKEELRLLENDKNELQSRKEKEIEELKVIISGYKEKQLTEKPTDEKSELRFNHLINSFHRKCSGRKGESQPKEKEWKELIVQFKKNMPVEQVAVCKKGLLSKLELQACILIMLDFSNGEIAVLFNTTPQRITNIKSRINKKLFNDESASTLQANLKYLIEKK